MRCCYDRTSSRRRGSGRLKARGAGDAGAQPTRGGSGNSLRTLLGQVHEQIIEGGAAVSHEVAQDAVTQALMTIRGIGPVLGLTIRAEVGSIGRFARAAELASYAGSGPRVEASAGRADDGRITRRWVAMDLMGARRSRDPPHQGNALTWEPGAVG